MTVSIILASKSSIRAELLRSAGLSPQIEPADIDERGLEAAWSAQALLPSAVAVALAEEKAKAVSRLRPEALVIGADQTLALGDERFTKAADRAAARNKLLRLRGRTHQLHSGYAISRAGMVLGSGVASASLAMRSFDETFLDRYLDRAGAGILASVGCYQLENLGVTLFERIEGDYFTILGLPLLPLLADLRRVGVDGI